MLPRQRAMGIWTHRARAKTTISVVSGLTWWMRAVRGSANHHPAAARSGSAPSVGSVDPRSLPDETHELRCQAHDPDGQADGKGEGKQEVRRTHHRRDAGPTADHQLVGLMDDHQAEGNPGPRHQNLEAPPKRLGHAVASGHPWTGAGSAETPAPPRRTRARSRAGAPPPRPNTGDCSGRSGRRHR